MDTYIREQITEIYGAHNLPGFTFGQVYTRTGTFACGSEGMTLKFHGKATHAAYPENDPGCAAKVMGDAMGSHWKFPCVGARILDII